MMDRLQDGQPYIEVEGTFKWTRYTVWLVLFELIVLCFLFQLFASFSLRLTPQEVMKPMIICAVSILAALLTFGAYDASCFKSLPSMYCRVFLGFLLGTLFCLSVTNWLFPTIDVVRFKFGFLFASLIVLTTLRSLIFGVINEKTNWKRQEE